MEVVAAAADDDKNYTAAAGPTVQAVAAVAACYCCCCIGGWYRYDLGEGRTLCTVFPVMGTFLLILSCVTICAILLIDLS